MMAVALVVAGAYVVHVLQHMGILKP